MDNLTDNARTVIEKRIARRKDDGTLETPEQVFDRVASFIALGDGHTDEDLYSRTREKFFRILSSLDFIPNSPCLTGANTDIGNLSACFVLPVEDSMDGIFSAIKNAALVHKTGGGTGFSFSALRPEGSRVSATGGVSSGPVSFMSVFDSATSAIKQGGTRRGANMGILRVDHPDILQFIKCKNDNESFSNFNISVGITDDFMEALYGDGDYELSHAGSEEKIRISAKEVWESIVQSAHATGDPGLVFLDRANRGKANPVPSLGPIEATNPCGEQFLYSYDSCNLGSINLANFAITKEDGSVDIDWARLSEVVQDSVHFLDNVIEMNKYPLKEIEKVTKALRRIGLGVMGFADLLMMMKIPYDSRDGVEMGRKIMKFVNDEAFKASKMLAASRGPFPLIEHSIYSETPVRHAARTTVAPTGTIAIIAGCSGGIEPAFALAFKRSHYLADNPNDRHEMIEVNPIFDKWLKTLDKELAEEILSNVLDGYRDGRVPSYFVTSHDISPEWHVRMQAAFQEFVDNSVSKTINLPNDADVIAVSNAYLLAWVTGCKGITVYRDGSKSNQVLSKISKEEERTEILYNTDKKPIDATRNAIHHTFAVGDFKGYIGVGLYPNGSPSEVFIIGSKVGSTTRGYLDTIGILMSKALQRGESVLDISTSLSGQRFEPAGFTGNPYIPNATSVVDYVARWLDQQFNPSGTRSIGGSMGNQSSYDGVPKRSHGDLCPECDGLLISMEGCNVCFNCGYSKC